jgi:biopolymer transport protein ExbD
MAMDVQVAGTGRRGRAHPEMNVTPLVDVVLVLLIIFMVLTAMMDDQFWVHVPEKPKDEPALEDTSEPGPEDLPIVVSVTKEGHIKINQDAYADAEFPERLRRMLVAKGDRRVYFDAQNGVPFERAMQVMDLARGGGAAHIAAVTEKIE